MSTLLSIPAAADWRERTRLGQRLLAEAKVEAAARELTAALAEANAASVPPSGMSVLLDALGRTEFHFGRYRSAKRYFQRAVEATSPGSDDLAATLNALAVTCKSLGELALAETAANSALQIRPRSADAWLTLGQVHFLQSRLAEVEAAARQALELASANDPEMTASACNDLAIICLKRRDFPPHCHC